MHSHLYVILLAKNEPLCLLEGDSQEGAEQHCCNSSVQGYMHFLTERALYKGTLSYFRKAKGEADRILEEMKGI